MNHTPEPWTYTYTSAAEARRQAVDEDGNWNGTDGGGASGFIRGKIKARKWGTSDIIAFLPHHRDPAEDEERGANALRIVSCVNGCKGIPDPETTVPELIAALRTCYAALSDHVQYEDDEGSLEGDAFREASAVLAKLEGGAK